jgi:hypothetical protein
MPVLQHTHNDKKPMDISPSFIPQLVANGLRLSSPRERFVVMASGAKGKGKLPIFFRRASKGGKAQR